MTEYLHPDVADGAFFSGVELAADAAAGAFDSPEALFDGCRSSIFDTRSMESRRLDGEHDELIVSRVEHYETNKRHRAFKYGIAPAWPPSIEVAAEIACCRVVEPRTRSINELSCPDMVLGHFFALRPNRRVLDAGAYEPLACLQSGMPIGEQRLITSVATFGSPIEFLYPNLFDRESNFAKRRLHH